MAGANFATDVGWAWFAFWGYASRQSSRGFLSARRAGGRGESLKKYEMTHAKFQGAASDGRSGIRYTPRRLSRMICSASTNGFLLPSRIQVRASYGHFLTNLFATKNLLITCGNASLTSERHFILATIRTPKKCFCNMPSLAPLSRI